MGPDLLNLNVLFASNMTADIYIGKTCHFGGVAGRYVMCLTSKHEPAIYTYMHTDHTKNHLYVILQLENDEQMSYATCTNL